MSITTEQLIALAKEAADLTNVADYVTTSTWLSWCNAGVVELHRFVTNKFRATFFRTFDFTLAAGESQQTLPSNFWKLKGLDIDPDTPRRREVRPYNFAERNRYKLNTLRDIETWCQDRRYNLIGSNKLKIQAEEQAAGNYRLYYTPKPKLLALVRSLTINNGVDHVNPTGPEWFFDDFGLSYPEQANVGDILTISGAGEGTNNGARAIVETTSTTSSITDGVAETETFTGITATLTTVIDPELEPYVEYVWLTAAIKSLIKEESYQQAAMLKDQRNLIRDDLLEAVEADEGGPRTVIDTDDDGVSY